MLSTVCEYAILESLAIMTKKHSPSAMVLVALAWVLIGAQDAHAYLDPGTGSYVFQMVIAVILSGAFTIKHFWHRLKARIVRSEPARPDDDASASES